ncbi:MAG: hypothetical protein ACI92C_002559, partial [Neolewinella sp.]
TQTHLNELSPLDLAFNADFASITAQNVLFQNTPDPVVNVTMITFELAAAGTATLNVQDVTGRLVKTVEVDGVAGLNQIEVQNIGAAGVYAYTLTSLLPSRWLLLSNSAA